MVVVALVVVVVSAAATCSAAAKLVVVGSTLAAPQVPASPAAGASSTPGDFLSFLGNCIFPLFFDEVGHLLQISPGVIRWC